MKMNETLIITGGNISNQFIKEYMKKSKFQYIIAVDKGLECLDSLNIKPTHIIGDFDSVKKEILRKYIDREVSTINLNPDKDYTDTDMGVQLAIELGNDIIVMGATGTRIDHTIANIHVLRRALEKDIKCRVIDEHNEIFLINRNTELIMDKDYTYVSLLPLNNTVKGVTLEGFKYKLNNKTLKIGESIGVSNEQIQEKAIIKIEEGILIIIKSKE